MSTKTYHSSIQTKGLNAHKSIDEGFYSSAKNILQGADVYCEQFQLVGKIDVFDIKSGVLTERKKKIKVIYDGYVFQVYAHYFALKEMGYVVNKIRLYSKDDNKIFWLKTPDENANMLSKFKKLINAMQNFNLHSKFSQKVEKCRNCIYVNLCDCASC